MTNCCWKSFECLKWDSLGFFLYEVPRKVLIGNVMWIPYDSASKVLHVYVFRFLKFVGKAWHVGRHLKISAGTLIFESRTTWSKLFTQKHVEVLSLWMVSSLNCVGCLDFKKWTKKVKIARGDHPVKENLYSGGTLTCSCSVRQGKLLSHRAALSEQASSRTTLLSVLRPSHRWSLKIGDFIGLLVSMESTNFET